jgi:hypothetical protein
MTESISVGQTIAYEVVWFSGPNGTGTVMPDPAASTFVSDNSVDLSVASTGNQTANVTGVAAGTANLTATSSTGVVAGFLDAGGAYQSGPLAFLVSVVLTITSGIIRRIVGAAPGA